ncbi:uncharacterized protein MONBRDRAFT_5765 [Monosiga brevicollis MX1]|uniref:Uncharacterized protein n=1 Tax=Monosiga brevicollis TaxID=81824 RepID=A9USE0_MONBE|nr:uncharacterized protein MONBRDRAFT_5765 [Monosiga brevicollis MX1]EDQ91764.1 predicted protein [Monosiga brevicollis MX1]|eukprot:XP_001743050.1 hypothetical protein [Monosiga brevicollis MX1]
MQQRREDNSSEKATTRRVHFQDDQHLADSQYTKFENDAKAAPRTTSGETFKGYGGERAAPVRHRDQVSLKMDGDEGRFATTSESAFGAKGGERAMPIRPPAEDQVQIGSRGPMSVGTTSGETFKGYGGERAAPVRHRDQVSLKMDGDEGRFATTSESAFGAKGGERAMPIRPPAEDQVQIGSRGPMSVGTTSGETFKGYGGERAAPVRHRDQVSLKMDGDEGRFATTSESAFGAKGGERAMPIRPPAEDQVQIGSRGPMSVGTTSGETFKGYGGERAAPVRHRDQVSLKMDGDEGRFATTSESAFGAKGGERAMPIRPPAEDQVQIGSRGPMSVGTTSGETFKGYGGERAAPVRHRDQVSLKMDGDEGRFATTSESAFGAKGGERAMPIRPPAEDQVQIGSRGPMSVGTTSGETFKGYGGERAAPVRHRDQVSLKMDGDEGRFATTSESAFGAKGGERAMPIRPPAEDQVQIGSRGPMSVGTTSGETFKGYGGERAAPVRHRDQVSLKMDGDEGRFATTSESAFGAKGGERAMPIRPPAEDQVQIGSRGPMSAGTTSGDAFRRVWRRAGRAGYGGERAAPVRHRDQVSLKMDGDEGRFATTSESAFGAKGGERATPIRPPAEDQVQIGSRGPMSRGRRAAMTSAATAASDPSRYRSERPEPVRHRDQVSLKMDGDEGRFATTSKDAFGAKDGERAAPIRPPTEDQVQIESRGPMSAGTTSGDAFRSYRSERPEPVRHRDQVSLKMDGDEGRFATTSKDAFGAKDGERAAPIRPPTEDQVQIGSRGPMSAGTTSGDAFRSYRSERPEPVRHRDQVSLKMDGDEGRFATTSKDAFGAKDGERAAPIRPPTEDQVQIGSRGPMSAGTTSGDAFRSYRSERPEPVRHRDQVSLKMDGDEGRFATTSKDAFGAKDGERAAPIRPPTEDQVQIGSRGPMSAGTTSGDAFRSYRSERPEPVRHRDQVSLKMDGDEGRFATTSKDAFGAKDGERAAPIRPPTEDQVQIESRGPMSAGTTSGDAFRSYRSERPEPVRHRDQVSLKMDGDEGRFATTSKDAFGAKDGDQVSLKIDPDSVLRSFSYPALSARRPLFCPPYAIDQQPVYSTTTADTYRIPYSFPDPSDTVTSDGSQHIPFGSISRPSSSVPLPASDVASFYHDLGLPKQLDIPAADRPFKQLIVSHPHEKMAFETTNRATFRDQTKFVRERFHSPQRRVDIGEPVKEAHLISTMHSAHDSAAIRPTDAAHRTEQLIFNVNSPASPPQAVSRYLEALHHKPGLAMPSRHLPDRPRFLPASDDNALQSTRDLLPSSFFKL